MKRAGHLFERVVDFHALRAAMRRAARGKSGRPEVAAFLFHQEAELFRLRRELLERTYRPGPHFTFTVRDPKARVISAPPFRDRVVHHALCAALEPVFERAAVHDSYACRRGKGTHAAVARARQFARSSRYFLKLDVERFFHSADHGVVKAAVRRVVKDPDVLWLLDTVIDHGPPGAPPGKGLPIGNLTSQHLANLYLAPLDRFVKQDLRAARYLRYMDDLLLFGRSRAELRGLNRQVERFLRDRLALQVNRAATVLSPVSEGVPFLGLRIWPAVTRLDRRGRRRMARKMKAAHARATGDAGIAQRDGRGDGRRDGRGAGQRDGRGDGRRDGRGAGPADQAADRAQASMASLVGWTRIADAHRLRADVVARLCIAHGTRNMAK